VRNDVALIDELGVATGDDTVVAVARGHRRLLRWEWPRGFKGETDADTQRPEHDQPGKPAAAPLGAAQGTGRLRAAGLTSECSSIALSVSRS
jgi:hypothetical protein